MRNLIALPLLVLAVILQSSVVSQVILLSGMRCSYPQVGWNRNLGTSPSRGQPKACEVESARIRLGQTIFTVNWSKQVLQTLRHRETI